MYAASSSNPSPSLRYWAARSSLSANTMSDWIFVPFIQSDALLLDLCDHAGGILHLTDEIINRAGQDVATDTGAQHGAVDVVVVVCQIAVLPLRHDEEVEVAVGTMPTFGSRSKEPDGLRVELVHHASQHGIERF